MEGEAVKEHLMAEILELGFYGPFAMGRGVDGFKFAAGHQDERITGIGISRCTQGGRKFSKGTEHVELGFEVFGERD